MSRHAPDPGIAGRPLNVLIVEDSAEDAERAVLELRRAGYAPDYRRVATAGKCRPRSTIGPGT
jgi:hypothetical protein